MKLMVAVVLLLGVLVSPARAADTIEAHYAAAGPWTVATADVGGEYRIHYPAGLGEGGVKHPIVTWGNGTDAVPTHYPGVLNQLASWGFVVIATTDTTTGTGTEMIEAAEYMVARNGDSSSVFHGKLDVGKVGAVGHSQGAGGSVNTATRSGGLISSVVPIALPAPIWVDADDRFHVDQLDCPVLFLSGTRDGLISPHSAIRNYYRAVPGAAAKAMLKGAGHNTIQGDGGGFLGYLTAWLMYTLQGDTHARGAFAGSTPEIGTNASWDNAAQKNLP
ncbi:alpha/beta hydrolase family protein [Nonomuraea sp. KM88]|uniref:alpha/beta hydrolase family protein n=1 Tax=Nonomuraea sp. KM88 TaxID=3457427 RepID=UPI003FCDC145